MRVLEPPLELPEPYWRLRLDAAYRWAASRFVADGLHRVADLGCGTGEGTAALAAAGLDVTGIDADHHCVRVASHHYRFGTIAFDHEDIGATSLPSHSCDGVMICGALERQHDPARLIAEARRLLRPKGLLLIVAPHRLTCSPGRTLPICAEHVWEFTDDELAKLVRSRFPDVHMFGVFHGPAVRRVERATGRPIAITLRSVPAADRARWLRGVLGRLSATDFTIGPGALRNAVDLVAAAR